MNKRWKALAAVTVAAALVFAPLVSAGAIADEAVPPDETAATEVVAPAEDTAPTVVDEPVAVAEDPAPVVEPEVVAEPEAAVTEEAPVAAEEAVVTDTDPPAEASKGGHDDGDWNDCDANKGGQNCEPEEEPTCVEDSKAKTGGDHEWCAPQAVHPVIPVWVDECGEGNGHWTYPLDTVGYFYKEWTFQGSSWITVLPSKIGDGYYIPLNEYFWLHAKETNTEPCLITVTPPTPMFEDPCGLDNAYWDASEFEGGTWGYGSDDEGNLYIEAIPADGYTFGDAQVEWYDHDSGELCPVGVPAQFDTGTPQPTCANAASYNFSDGWYEFTNVWVYVERDSDEWGNYVYVEVQAKDGFVLEGLSDAWTVSEDATYAYRYIDLAPAIGFQSEDPNAPCFVQQSVVPQPAAPTFNDVCGTAGDGWTVPSGTDQFEYVVTEDGDTVTVDAVLFNENDVWAEGAVTSWSHTFTNEACPVNPPTPNTPAALAVTGGGDVAPILPYGAAIIVALGIALTAFGAIRRRVRG